MFQIGCQRTELETCKKTVHLILSIHSFGGKLSVSQALPLHGAACTKCCGGERPKNMRTILSVFQGSKSLSGEAQLTAKMRVKDMITLIFILSLTCSLHLPLLCPVSFVTVPTPPSTLSLSTYIPLKWRGRKERSQNLGSDSTSLH